jgi:hypothetical protein
MAGIPLVLPLTRHARCFATLSSIPPSITVSTTPLARDFSEWPTALRDDGRGYACGDSSYCVCLHTDYLDSTISRPLQDGGLLDMTASLKAACGSQ